jgi:3-oxoacyl-[acyl-carrier protein] reductase
VKALSRIPSSVPDLTGRVAVVTGGARGIGREVARVLAGVGALVVVWDLDEGPTADQEVSDRIVGESVDVSDSAAVDDAVRSIVSEHGRLDILVNNVGIGDRVDLPEVSRDFWVQRGNVNIFGTIACTRAAYPIMARQGGGKIVNVSSVSAKVGGVTSEDPRTGRSRSGPVYSATKGAILSFTRWVAKTGGSDGILVNSVCPGPVATEAIEGAVYDLSQTPVDRLGTTGDVAQAILYFGSQMSNYVTGQSLNVDGGLHFD